MKDLVIDFDKQLEKQALYSILKDLKGEQVIKIKKRVKGRTILQNKYYWGVVLDYISRETGMNAVLLHEIFKEMFIPEVVFDDDFELSTTSLNVEQIWEYITKIRFWAKDFLNLSVPDPDGVIL